jgi:hypothetical protein
MRLPFEELRIPDYGDSVLIEGVAHLEECDESFEVTAIELSNGRWLRPVREGQSRDAHLFRAIASVIYDQTSPEGAQAAELWAEETADRRRGDPDRAYDERRDHLAMGWCAA